MIGDPIAFVLVGGNGPPNEFPATVRFPNFTEAALSIGPTVKAAGIKRVLYHNPGGDHWLGWIPNPANIFDKTQEDAARSIGVDVRAMWVNQWNLSEASGCRFADRERLITGHRLLRHFGVEEVIYYLGGPTTLRNAAKEGPACVEMFLACGKGVSLGFDAVAWHHSRWKAGDDVCRFFEWIKKAGAKVYVEPRLSKEQVAAGLGKHVDGTIAFTDFDLGPHFKPDLSIQPGETIRDLGPAATLEAKTPAGVTPCYRDPTNRNWTK